MEKCFLCKSKEQDEIKYGEFMTRNDISVHYFCLLLTSNLLQRGKDHEGFLGFLVSDIKKEVARVESVVCFYCKIKGANITCCAQKCRKSFHLICGIKNNCENQFVGTFKSFCHLHVSKKKPRGLPATDENCCICYDSLRGEGGSYNRVTMLQAPCCKNGWFHKWCLASFAKSAGYFFKCPLCNDSKKFRESLVYRGIFIPDRDASWELEPNAFSELLERPGICSADECTSRGGRTSNSGRNRLILCLGCGSVAMHRCCIGKEVDNFYCIDCQETFTEVNDKTVVNVSRHSESDEEEDVDICGEIDEEPVLSETASSEEVFRPIGRLRNAMLSTTDEEEDAFDVNVTDTEEDIVLPPRRRRRLNRLCSFEDNGSESNDDVGSIRIRGCRRSTRIESSDSGNSMETVICEAKLRTSNNSESFFDSGAGSDRSDISADKSLLMQISKNNIEESTDSRSETSRGTSRFTSLNNEPNGDWCIARRTRRQSMYSDMKICLEDLDVSNESSTSLPQSSSFTNVFQKTEQLPIMARKIENQVEMKLLGKQPIVTETPVMENINKGRFRTRRSKSHCVESPKPSSTQRRSSVQKTMGTSQDPGCSSLQLHKFLQTEALSNKRSRNDSQSSTDVSLSKKQKSDNENDCINTISRPRRRSSRSRSPLSINYSSSINAFITPSYIKEKQCRTDGRKEDEDFLRGDTLKPQIEKMFIKNQTNISNQKPIKDNPTTSAQEVSHTSCELSINKTFRETFANSYKILLSANKRRRSRKNAFQRITDNNVPSNQTRIETFFKRI